jgi:hypothetical protein
MAGVRAPDDAITLQDSPDSPQNYHRDTRRTRNNCNLSTQLLFRQVEPLYFVLELVCSRNLRLKVNPGPVLVALDNLGGDFGLVSSLVNSSLSERVLGWIGVGSDGRT